MKTVKIAELRNRPSYYLRRVQQGESLLVCDRDRVIARIARPPRVQADVVGALLREREDGPSDSGTVQQWCPS